MTKTHDLRVLIANHRPERLELLAKVVTDLGHEVIAREIDVAEVAQVTSRLRPDLALVGFGQSSEHALRLITEIVRGSFCPVIALLEAFDGEWIDKAAERGAYFYIVDSRPEELQGAIDITLRRFHEIESLHGAFERGVAETLREAQAMQRRKREVLDLHDGVVQQLEVAHLLLELDRREDSSEVVLAALGRARSIVARAIEELHGIDVPLEHLVRETAPG